MADKDRRRVLKSGLVVAGAGLLGNLAWIKKTFPLSVDSRRLDNDFVPPMIAFPEKQAMRMHSDRPPLLETSRTTFADAVTPNDQFFVRWHHAAIPDSIALDRYRISISGHVDNPLSISLDALKRDFDPVDFYAVKQCGGNGRSNYTPFTSGIQWGYGAMGCAQWKGVRLKDILAKAKLKPNSQFIKVNGLDRPVFPETPSFIRKLDMDECLRDDVIIAYEMNGSPIPYLNGYPAVLIVPGYFADHWVKMIERIEILKKDEPVFYTDKAYRIPGNIYGSVPPGDPLPTESRPLKTLKVKSVIASPGENEVFQIGSRIKVSGIAFDGGSGIKEVLVSIDGGTTWGITHLEKDLGKYAFRKWAYVFEAKEKGSIQILSRAISRLNETQPLVQNMEWNPGGYQWNAVDNLTINIL